MPVNWNLTLQVNRFMVKRKSSTHDLKSLNHWRGLIEFHETFNFNNLELPSKVIMPEHQGNLHIYKKSKINSDYIHYYTIRKSTFETKVCILFRESKWVNRLYLKAFYWMLWISFVHMSIFVIYSLIKPFDCTWENLLFDTQIWFYTSFNKMVNFVIN